MWVQVHHGVLSRFYDNKRLQQITWLRDVNCSMGILKMIQTFGSKIKNYKKNKSMKRVIACSDCYDSSPLLQLSFSVLSQLEGNLSEVMTSKSSNTFTCASQISIWHRLWSFVSELQYLTAGQNGSAKCCGACTSRPSCGWLVLIAARAPPILPSTHNLGFD